MPTLSPPRTRSNGAKPGQPGAVANANGAIPHDESDSHALWAIVVTMLGILVAILGVFAASMWFDAHNAKSAAEKAAPTGSRISANSSAGKEVRCSPSSSVDSA